MDSLIILQHEVEQWLYLEAELLDSLDFDGWSDLLSEEIVYQMPLRINQVGNKTPDYTVDTLAFDDDKYSLQLRIDRLKTDYAWAEIPPSRTRRHVSNVRIKSSSEDSVEVHSYLLLYRSRSTDTHADFISGKRQDLLKKEDGIWKLAKRFFIVDQSTISTRNLAIFV